MRRRRTQRIWIIVFGISALLMITAGAGTAWIKRHDIARSLERNNLPQPATYEQVKHTQLPTAAPAVSHTSSSPKPVASLPPTLKAAINLAVPFTSQAPYANWEDPYGEFCEEASVLMAISYVHGTDIPSPEFADQQLLAIKTFEEKRFGYYKDTTAAETAVVVQEYFKYPTVRLIEDPTINDIKQAVAVGKLVLVPAAGRLLGNPYFQTPGPLYHMLVIKGYTADGKFITNDPGTRRGADFLYTESVVMNAMHNWRSDGKIELGKKVVILVG